MAVNDTITIASTDRGDTGRIRPFVIPELVHPEPDQTPFLVLSNMMRGFMQVPNMTYETQSEWDLNRELEVTADSAVGADISVDDRSNVIARQVYAVIDDRGNPLDLNVRVNATPAAVTAGSIDVTPGRPFNSVDKVIPAGARLKLVATVGHEDATPAAVRIRATDRKTQRLTVLQRTWAITWHMQLADMYGPKEEARIEAQQFREYAKDLENLFLWSRGGIDTSTAGQTIWATEGVFPIAMRNNRFHAGGTLDFSAFVEFAQAVNRFHGAHEKFAFCSNSLSAKIARWAEKMGIVRQPADVETLKLNIKHVDIPGIAAPITIVPHYGFDGVNAILLVDFRGIQPVEHGETLIERGSNRYGIAATPGQLRTEAQVVRNVGLKSTMDKSLGVILEVDRIAA